MGSCSGGVDGVVNVADSAVEADSCGSWPSGEG
jgi:hypothetical protein